MMGNLLRLLQREDAGNSCCSHQKYDVFLDFESKSIGLGLDGGFNIAWPNIVSSGKGGIEYNWFPGALGERYDNNRGLGERDYTVEFVHDSVCWGLVSMFLGVYGCSFHY